MLTSEEVPRGATQFKCAPPIREAANRDLLWDGLRDGTIDFVVSDHSPCTADLKSGDSGDFSAAWGGIATLGLTLPVVWTEARRRGFGLADIARWLCAGPAEFVGLERGVLRPGARADLVAWDPDADWLCSPSHAEFRNKVSPWFGRELTGRPVTTWLGGSAFESSPGLFLYVLSTNAKGSFSNVRQRPTEKGDDVNDDDEDTDGGSSHSK